jgi:hypothetical protein
MLPIKLSVIIYYVNKNINKIIWSFLAFFNRADAIVNSLVARPLFVIQLAVARYFLEAWGGSSGAENAAVGGVKPPTRVASGWSSVA